MAFPKITNGRKDGQLTNISLAYTNAEYINSKVLPVVPNLKDETGFIGEFGQNHLRVYESSKRAVWDEGEHRVDYTISNSKSYRIDYYDLSMYIPDRLQSQLQLPFDARRDALINLEAMREQIMEDALATTLADTSVFTTNATPSTLWDVATSDPLNDMETGAETIRAATGRRPNKAWTNSDVLSKLSRHPNFIDRVSGIKTILSKQDVIEIIKAEIGLTDIYVGSAIKVSSEQGQTVTKGNIWADDFGLYYAPDRPSLMTPSLGYRFEIAGLNKRVTVRRHQEDIGDKIKLEWAYQDKILDAANSAYLLDQVIT